MSLDCPRCDYIARTKQGLGLHLAWRHDVKRTDKRRGKKHRAIVEARRERLLREGLCAECGKEPIAVPRSVQFCESCLDRKTEGMRHNRYCSPGSLEKTRERDRRYTTKRKKATMGRICVGCSRTDAEVLWSAVRAFCTACDRRRFRNGHCPECNAILWLGGKLCKYCGWEKA